MQFLIDKHILSEACIEFSKYSSDDNLANAQKYAHDMIGDLNAGMNVFLDWNLVLDERGGPNHVNNFCDAPFLFDTTSEELKYRELQSYIWHFSHYIDHSSVRIGVTKYTSKVEVTAFETRKGLAVIFLNSNDYGIPIHLRLGNLCAPIIIEANSIASGFIEV